METIDHVLEQAVLNGWAKIDWKEGESRTLSDGDWSLGDLDNYRMFEGHLHPTTITRMQQLTMAVEVDTPPNQYGPQSELIALFDPVTRRIEAMEVWSIDDCSTLLTLMFWPGLESARKLVIATTHQWRRAIADGWFDGI